MPKTKRKSARNDPRETSEETSPSQGRFSFAHLFVISVLVFAGLLLLWALFCAAGMRDQIARFTETGLDGMAALIARNKAIALLHGALMSLLGALVIWLFLFGKLKTESLRRAVAWGIVLLMAGDALWLSRHYVQTMPASFVASNDLIKVLKSEPEHRRVALVSQQGPYGALLTYAFPFHDIRPFNATQMPRMPDDYTVFLSRLSSNPIRLWQLCAVGFVVAPANVAIQLFDDPATEDKFKLVYPFNFFQNADGGFSIASASESRPGEHTILRLVAPAPRYALFAGWSSLDDEAALNRLSSDTCQPFQTLLIAPECSDGLPEPDGEGLTGAVAVREYRSGRIVLNTSSDRPAVLRAADKYDPDWTAFLDGERVPVRRVDYLFQGVFIPSGMHELVLVYKPQMLSLSAMALAALLCVAAALSLSITRGVSAGVRDPKKTGF